MQLLKKKITKISDINCTQSLAFISDVYWVKIRAITFACSQSHHSLCRSAPRRTGLLHKRVYKKTLKCFLIPLKMFTWFEYRTRSCGREVITSGVRKKKGFWWSVCKRHTLRKVVHIGKKGDTGNDQNIISIFLCIMLFQPGFYVCT